MNERIRLLAEQAGMALKPRRLYDDNEPNGYLESDLDYLENNLEATRMFFEGGLERFAEEIVAECEKAILAEIAVTDISGEVEKAWEMGMECGVYTIKKHFEVKE